ncbi:unnamed protein product [Prunus armeniaca]
MATRGDRSKPAKFQAKPGVSPFFFGEITAARGGAWLGLEEDGGPVILVPTSSTLVAGREHGRPKRGQLLQPSQERRERGRKREKKSDFIKPFSPNYGYATKGILIVSLSLQLRFELTTCLRTHLAPLYAKDRVTFYDKAFYGMQQHAVNCHLRHTSHAVNT